MTTYTNDRRYPKLVEDAGPLDVAHEVQVLALKGKAIKSPIDIRTWKDIEQLAIYTYRWKLNRDAVKMLVEHCSSAGVEAKEYIEVLEKWGAFR